MELNNIERLLEKYEEGQTTLQEEAQLKHYFTTETVAPHLEVYRTIFAYYSSDEQFSYQRPLQMTRSKPTQYRWLGSAVVIAIMFSAYMSLTSRENHMQLSTEEQFAYNETLKAFDLISNQLHKGTASFKALNIISTSFEKGQQNVVFLEEFNTSTNRLFNTK